jgi:RimJ/RimL family protein N-acetyltransferase
LENPAVQVTLTGTRVTLRPPTDGDLDAIYRACQDVETQRFTPVPVPYLEMHAAEFVDAAREGWRSNAVATFAICDAATGGFDGAIDVRFRPARSASVGYSIAPWARRRGFATEALQLVCHWTFTEHDVDRIDWEAVVGNWGSRRAAEAVGFQVAGQCGACIDLRGVRYDAWRAALLPTDLVPLADSPVGKP